MAETEEKKASASSKKSELHVCAAQVQVETANGILHLYKGAVVPDDITDESLKNLQELGFVTEDDVEPY